MIAAVIRNNLVVNIVVADANVDTPPEDCIFVNIGENSTVKIGATYEPSSGDFVNPAVEPEPVVVPESVNPRQVRLVLLAQGLLASVEAMIAQQDEATRIAWQYASEFRRDDPLLVQLAANLVPPLTSQQLDDFFITAATL
jgi:hypothetical protein